MNTSEGHGIDWSDVLAAYEAYVDAKVAEGAVWGGLIPVSLNEFLSVEYEIWREEGCFLVHSGLGEEHDRLRAELGAETARHHVAELPFSGDGPLEDLTCAYIAYATAACENGMAERGWSAPNAREFCLGPYELWLNTAGGTNPYSEVFEAMRVASEDTEMDLMDAGAVRDEAERQGHEEISQEDEGR